MADFLGQTPPPDLESIDYLGTKVPTSFKAQPALPTGKPAAASSSAPSTIGGSGLANTARHIFTRPESDSLMDTLRGVFDTGGGPGVDSGGPGAGVSPSPPGSIVGWDPQSFQAAINFVTPLGINPAGKGLSAIGTLGKAFAPSQPDLGFVGPEGKVQGAFPGERSGTGSKALDAVLGFLGVPMGLLEGVFTSPELTHEFVQTLAQATENLGLPDELVQALKFEASGQGAFALGAPGAGIATGVGPGQPGAPGMGSTPMSWGPAQTPPGFGRTPTEEQGTGLGFGAPPGPAPALAEGFPGEGPGAPSGGTPSDSGATGAGGGDL